MKEEPQQVITCEKNLIDKDKYEFIVKKYYIIPFIEGKKINLKIFTLLQPI